MTPLRIRWLTSLAAVCASIIAFPFAAANAADEKKPETSSATPKAQLEALKADAAKARDSFIEQMNAAKTDQERDKVIAEAQPMKFAPRFAEFIKANARDPIAIEAMSQLIETKPFGIEFEEGLKVIAANHASTEAVTSLFGALGEGFTPDIEDFYRTLIEKSSNRTIQARACLGVAQFLSGLKAKLGSLPAEGTPDSEQAEKYLGKEILAKLRLIDHQQLQKKAEAYLERAKKDFGDVSEGGVAIAKLADRELKATREKANLDIGSVAPEIEGEDIEGKTFKLSDYRGKVVVIDFWGDW